MLRKSCRLKCKVMDELINYLFIFIRLFVIECLSVVNISLGRLLIFKEFYFRGWGVGVRW